MAAKKYYAVRKGKITGVFESWEACRASVEGFAGAQYKGFPTREEAASYVGEGTETFRQLPREGCLLVYVDGSYDDSLKKYAFGCVFILPDGRIYTECGNGDREQSLQHRNVTGEMLGAMYATKVALRNGFRELEICYDYLGIEKWVTGEWRSKTLLTQKYAEAMRDWQRNIRITFTKVAAHTNVKYNELADRLAKKGLTEGEGVPPVRSLEEMEPWEDNGKWSGSD